MRASLLLAFAVAGLVSALQMSQQASEGKPVLYSVITGPSAEENSVRLLVDSARNVGGYKGTIVLVSDRPDCLAKTLGQKLLGGAKESGSALVDTYPGVEGGKVHIVKAKKTDDGWQLKSHKAMALSNIAAAQIEHPVSSVIAMDPDVVIGQNLEKFMSYVRAKEQDGKSFLSAFQDEALGNDELSTNVLVMQPGERVQNCMEQWKVDILNHQDSLAETTACPGVGIIPGNFFWKPTEDASLKDGNKKKATFVHTSSPKISKEKKKAFFLALGTTVDLEGHSKCGFTGVDDAIDDAVSLMQINIGGGEAEAKHRMQWWTQVTEAKEPTDQYLLFTNDAGGLNNIRLGWEAVGLIAQGTGRTLVLPPASPMYLLDFGARTGKDAPSDKFTTKTKVEDLISLAQLKGNVPTLTAQEFEQRTGLTWQKAILQSQQLPESQKSTCNLEDYNGVESDYLFLDGEKREGFSCMAWAQLGAPNEALKKKVGEQGFALLQHGFMWHDDAFDIASKVVNYLGMFNYLALHARYNDFQFKDHQQNPMKIFNKWSSFIQPGTVVYLATDEPDKFQSLQSSLLQASSGSRVLMWQDLFEESTGNLLGDVKAKYSKERWFKLTGPVEELICTFSKVFIGSPLSTFSGHIQRMRIAAEAPVTSTIMHTDKPVLASINNQIQLWTKLDKKKNFKPLPLNKGSEF